MKGRVKTATTPVASSETAEVATTVVDDAQPLLPPSVAQNAAAALRTIRRASSQQASSSSSTAAAGGNNNSKRQLFQSPQLHLTIGLRPSSKKSAAAPSMLLTLPHAVHSTATDSGCLITKDLPARPADYEATAAHYAEQLRSAGCHAGLTVLPLRELTVAYMPFEAKRRLCAAYDYFLADRRIAHRLGGKLGSHFAAKNRRKLPLPVDLEARDLAAEIDRGRRTVRVCLTGTTLSCLVGQMDTEAAADGAAAATEDQQLLDNVLAACGQLAKRLGGLACFSGLYLRHQACGNVPIYAGQEQEQPPPPQSVATDVAAMESKQKKTAKKVTRDLEKDLAELGATLWDKDLLGETQLKKLLAGSQKSPRARPAGGGEKQRKKRLAFGKLSAGRKADVPPAKKTKHHAQQRRQQKPKPKQ